MTANRTAWLFRAIAPACCAGLLALTSARAQSAARICLEEEELSMTGEDGTVSTALVSKDGPRKKALLEEVKEKTLKKMELRSEGELIQKGLQSVYAEETGKVLKVKALAEPRLAFYDDGGKLIKTVPVGIAINEYESSGGGREPVRSFTSNIRHATVSKDGRYALLTEDRAELEPVKDASGKVTFYGVDGTALWEKEYPRFRAVIGEISGSGQKAFLFEYWRTDLSPLPEKEIEHLFSVYGRNGKRLISYPRDPAQAGGRVNSGDYKASPGGKYAALRQDGPGKRQEGWMFFDTDGRSSWFFGDKDLAVTSLSDDGLCGLALASGAGARTIDLKTKKFHKLD